MQGLEDVALRDVPLGTTQGLSLPQCEDKLPHPGRVLRVGGGRYLMVSVQVPTGTRMREQLSPWRPRASAV